MPPILFYSEAVGWTSWENLAMRENLRFQAYHHHMTDLHLMPWDKLPGAVVLAQQAAGETFALLQVNGVALLVQLARRAVASSISLTAAANSFEQAQAAIDLLRPLFPEATHNEEEDKIDVRFWTNGTPRPNAVDRSIQAPEFYEIADNYAPEARRVLDHMVSDQFHAGSGGQLLLWHGPPGTGKTFALRALAQAWRKWCRIEYIVDPEQFFGDANYLMAVMLNAVNRYEEEEPWRLLIFEDTGELLSADARTRAGQGLSRLLNVVDGFVGQGLRTLILITTNEDFDKLHPAVTRPGRTAVKAHFGPLPAKQAKEWGKRHNIDVNGEHTLAELFAIRDGAFNDAPVPLSRPIGFNPDVQIAIP